jgi:Protein of unknown function (DUF2934)
MKMQIGRYEFVCLDAPDSLLDKPGIYLILHQFLNEYELIAAGECESLMDWALGVDFDELRLQYSGKVLAAVYYMELLSDMARHSIVNSIVEEFGVEAKIELVATLQEQISERAYQLWQAHGCLHGRDKEDWLKAEAEMMAKNGQNNVG